MVEGSGFENRRIARYRGFESLLLRHRRKLVAVGVLFALLAFALYQVRLHTLYAMPERDGAVSPSGQYRIAIFVPTFPEQYIPTSPGNGIGWRTAIVRLVDRDGRVLRQGSVHDDTGDTASADSLLFAWTPTGISFGGDTWTTPTPP